MKEVVRMMILERRGDVPMMIPVTMVTLVDRDQDLPGEVVMGIP